MDGDLLCQTIQVEGPICFNPFVDRRLAMNVWKMIQLRNTLTMTFDSCEALHKVSIVPIAVILVYGNATFGHQGWQAEVHSIMI